MKPANREHGISFLPRKGYDGQFVYVDETGAATFYLLNNIGYRFLTCLQEKTMNMIGHASNGFYKASFLPQSSDYKIMN